MANRHATDIPGNIGGQKRPRGVMSKIEKARDRRGAVRRLVGYLEPYQWLLVTVFFLQTFHTGFVLVGPYLMGTAIDKFIASGNISGLNRLVLLMIGAYIGVWLTHVGQSVIMATISQKAMHALRRDLFEHLHTLSISFFDQQPHGDLMSRLTNDLNIMSRMLSQNVTELFTSLLSLVGIMIAIFALNFWLALGSMVVFPLMMGVVGIVGSRTRKRFRRLQKHIGQLNSQLEEMFSAQRVILAFGQEADALSAFDKINETVRASGVKARIYATLVPPLMGILSNANIAIVAGLGGWMVLKGLASIGNIVTFISYSRHFARPLRHIGHLYNELQSALAGAERVFEIIDTQPDRLDHPEAITLDTITGDVQFDQVNFSYVSGMPVIKEMSLHVSAGQTIALVGPTGAGKTTIVNLLARFYDLDEGAIFIDGQDIRLIQQGSLRRQFGIVLQDTFLFSGTVMENIRYGRINATDEECIDAAKLAEAHHFICHLPRGYHTCLSERGSNLSEGQRQLLAIARAILANPGILILDEATSSVDTRTEIHIQKALLQLMAGRTSFVIAHRLSTIRDADQVLVINGGRIVERGPHDALLAQRGFYYKLYMSQFKGHKNPSTI